MWHDTLAELRQCKGRSPLSVLILGPVTPEQRAQALQELRAGCVRHAYYPQRSMTFNLPIVTTNIIVVTDKMADISSDEQQALLQWLEQHRGAMVLSFATKLIFPLVVQDKFFGEALLSTQRADVACQCHRSVATRRPLHARRYDKQVHQACPVMRAALNANPLDRGRSAAQLASNACRQIATPHHRGPSINLSLASERRVVLADVAHRRRDWRVPAVARIGATTVPPMTI
jgi:hypothetical protein